MLKKYLRKRNYPFVVFFALPENCLDLLTFILFAVYCILKYIFVLPTWCDLFIAIIFSIFTLIFKRYNVDNQYRYYFKHSMSFSIFFGIWFLLEILSLV